MEEFSNIASGKKDCRAMIKQRKKEHSENERAVCSAKIFEAVEQTDIFRIAKTVMLYWSLPDEVQTTSFIEKWYTKKTILLPCTEGDDIVVKSYCGVKNMIINHSFGIAEPDTEPVRNLNFIDLIIVPGVAFDKDFNRLGRGRAFYDRFLRKTDAYKMGVCFQYQYLDSVPHTEDDVKMDGVIFA